MLDIYRWTLMSITLCTGLASAGIQGVVRDSSSATPLDSVRVTLGSSGTVAWTNAAGAFQFAPSSTVRLPPPDLLRLRGERLVSGRDILIRIADLRGRIVVAGLGSVNPSHLPSGIYRVRAEADERPLIRTGGRTAMPRRVSESFSPRAASTPDTLRFRKRGYPEKSIPVAPADTSLAIRLAWSAEQEAYDSARAVLDRATTRTPRDTLGIDTAAALFRSYLSRWPAGLEPVNARWWLGHTQYLLGRFPAADSLFGNIVDSFPSSPRVDDALYEQGRCRHELGDYAGALRKFRTLLTSPALSGSSRRHDATYWSGRSLFALDSLPTAATAFRSVLDSFPSDTSLRDDATYYLGRSEYGLGASDSTRYTVARALFLSVPATWPTSIRADNASYYAGRCWHQLHQFDSAIAQYRATERNYPAGSLLDAGLHYTAVAFYDLKLYDSTIAIESSLPARFPASSYRDDALYYAGKSLYRKGLLDSAALRMDAVIAWPQNSNVLDYALYYRSRIFLDKGSCASASPLVTRLRTEFATSQARTLADAYATSAGCTVL